MSKDTRMIGAFLGTAGLVLLIIMQFVPLGGVETSSFFGSVAVDAYPHGSEAQAGGESDSTGWYDSDFDDEDGIGEIRAGMVLHYIGMGLAAIGVLLAFMGKTTNTAYAMLGAFALGLTAFILFNIGTGNLFENGYENGAGFYMAIASFSTLLVGGVLIHQS